MLPTFTVFDVETTGLDPRRGHKIIELAALRIEDGKILTDAPFNSFVNPERPIPMEAMQVNKIRNEDVLGAPTIDQVIPMFLEFAADSLLVAHNAEFDMGFLNTEKEHCWGYIDIPDALCTMRLSQSIFPNEFRHNLNVVALRLGLEMPTSRHRALPDVSLTAQALLKMIAIGQIETEEDLRQRAGWREMVA
ncbi:MAG: 3'-5' exonuclease [Patescibacteria group bacterium]